MLMSAPVNVNIIPVYGDAFDKDRAEIEGESYETVALPLDEISRPSVNAALKVLPIPSGALHLMDDAETHAVTRHPVSPKRASGV